MPNFFQFLHPGNRIPNAACLKVGQGQAQQMPEQLSGQCHVEAVGGVGKDEHPQDAQNCLKNGSTQQSNRHHIQRGKAFLYHHFVDDDLSDDGRG